MNKRGDLSDIFEHLASLWVYVLIALAIAIFIFLVKSDAISPVGNNLTFEKMAENADIDLINFLRTPTKFDLDRDGVEEEKTFAELIMYYQYDSDIIASDQIKEKLKPLLDSHYGPQCYKFWTRGIGLDPKEPKVLVAATSKINIPSLEGGTSEVTLSIYDYYFNPKVKGLCFET
ncbi:hypothetical protein KY339_00715 [Candidatus Woesearchaeota archaeon]|nr:hypothetical protein [Candidatus Woesearchaeota archaeon]